MRKYWPEFISLVLCAAYLWFALSSKTSFLHMNGRGGMSADALAAEIFFGALLIAGCALALHGIVRSPGKGRIMGLVSFAFFAPFVADAFCYLFLNWTKWNGSKRPLFILVTEALVLGAAVTALWRNRRLRVKKT